MCLFLQINQQDCWHLRHLKLPQNGIVGLNPILSFYEDLLGRDVPT